MAKVKKKQDGHRVAQRPKALVWPTVLFLIIFVLTWVEAAIIKAGGLMLYAELYAERGIIAQLGPWLILWVASQRIIDGNLFKQYVVVSVLFGIGCTSVWAPLLDTRSQVYFFLPLVYIVWLRVLLCMFFREYTSSKLYPVLVTDPRSYKGYPSYKPTRRESLFSGAVLMGMFAWIILLNTLFPR